MRVIFRIYGSVQGIGYRWFVRDAAAGLALTGLVRNLRDGSVEGEAQGGKKAIDALMLKLKTGHPLAVITKAEVNITEELAGEKDFVIDSSRQGR